MTLQSAIGWILVWLVQHPVEVLLVIIAVLVLALSVFMALVRL